jgi:hypothetical protein
MGQKIITLLTARTATNGSPAGASAGASTNGLKVGGNVPDTCSIFVKSTAGSGDMTVTIKIWGYVRDSPISGSWFPLGTGATAADRGKLNEQSAIDEVVPEGIRHVETISYVGSFDRVYAEVTDIGGDSTAVSVYVLAEDMID